MKHILLSHIIVFVFCIPGFSQNVGISANGAITDTSAGLDINFTDKGLLIPRLSLTSTTDTVTIASPATSLLVYNTNAGMTDGSVGYWYWDGSIWLRLNSGTSVTAWSVLGNASTTSSANFIGTNDNVGLSLRTNNIEALHIDSLQNIGIGVINTTNKFEVAGSFRMHQDSFNMLHTTDLFPALLPDVQFAGTTYRMPAQDGTFVSGIVDTPPAAGDNTYAVSGYLDLASGIQNLFLSNSAGMMMNSQSATANSYVNLDNAGDLNLSSNRGVDSSSSIHFYNNGIDLYNSVNSIGNTYMNLNDSSVSLNINENVDNSRNTNLLIKPNDYNIYNNDNQNGNSSGYNFSSLKSNLYLNSAFGNTHLNLTDSTYDQYTGESITGRYSGVVINPDNYNIYNNDNATNTSSSNNFSSKGFSQSINDNNQNLNLFLGGQVGQLKLYLNDNTNNTQSGFDITSNNAQFFNNDNALGNNAAYNLTNNSFSVNVNNATDNRATSLSVDQNSMNFNQYNNTSGSNSNLNLSDNGVSFTSNDGNASAGFLMTGTTASFTSTAPFTLGVGTTIPKSSLETAGSFGTAITTTTGDITLDDTHYTIIVTGGSPDITLPAAGSGNFRRSYRIINQASTAIDISSFINFNGVSAIVVPANSKIEVQSDGVTWYQVD